MKQRLLAIFAILSSLQMAAQSFTKAVNDAYLLTQVAEKFHVAPRPLNDTFSSDAYAQFLRVLDGQKIFFLATDIRILDQYKYQLDDLVKGRNPAFLQLVSSIYQKRLAQVQAMVNDICKVPFNFYFPDRLTLLEDSTFPQNPGSQKVKLYKILKAGVLNAIISNSNELEFLPLSKQNLYLRSSEPTLRKKMQQVFNRSINQMLGGYGGLQKKIGDEYCKAIAKCYDPHTEYMPLTQKDDLETELGEKNMAFGFTLRSDAKGNILINDLKPGSPAFRSGQINRGDRIIFLQWDGSTPIDLQGATLKEINQVLNSNNEGNVILTIKKPDGTKRRITLSKEKLENDTDDNKVKSFLLKGEKTIGFISLPAFYEDWENEKGINGCANDVAKEIVKLKNSNIDGLVLDLRFNSGGSMQEAIEMAGIFIDEGPVGLYKRRDEEVVILKDVNKGTIYDGPLVLMVNGYSASASEMLAATLQDYNRAVIVGSPTYGKSTTQVILPLDTAVLSGEDASQSKADSYLKITIAQLFRITGKSFQGTGVIPDIMLPDITTSRENTNLFVLPQATVPPNRYYTPGRQMVFTGLNEYVGKELVSFPYFRQLKQYEAEKRAQVPGDVILSLPEMLTSRRVTVPVADTISNNIFTVDNNEYDNERLSMSKTLKQVDKEWQKHLSQDPYLQLTYSLMLQLIK